MKVPVDLFSLKVLVDLFSLRYWSTYLAVATKKLKPNAAEESALILHADEMLNSIEIEISAFHPRAEYNMYIMVYTHT